MDVISVVKGFYLKWQEGYLVGLVEHLFLIMYPLHHLDHRATIDPAAAAVERVAILVAPVTMVTELLLKISPVVLDGKILKIWCAPTGKLFMRMHIIIAKMKELWNWLLVVKLNLPLRSLMEKKLMEDGLKLLLIYQGPANQDLDLQEVAVDHILVVEAGVRIIIAINATEEAQAEKMGHQLTEMVDHVPEVVQEVPKRNLFVQDLGKKNNQMTNIAVPLHLIAEVTVAVVALLMQMHAHLESVLHTAMSVFENSLEQKSTVL